MTRFTLGLTVICSLGLAQAGLAQTMTKPMATTPSASSEVHGATTGLGSSHRFQTMTAAHQHCPQDKVVWASAKAKTYRLSQAQGYGKTGNGFYACRQEADDAGFHAH